MIKLFMINAHQLVKRSGKEGRVVYEQAKKTSFNNPKEGQLSSFFRN